MTLTITPIGEHRHDQTSGLQSGGILDKDDVALSTDLNQLPDAFESFLEGLSAPISAGQLDNAADYGAAMEDPGAGFFINVSADSGETIDDLFFSQSDGSLFDGQVATYNSSNIYVVGSTDPIYLYSFAGGDILIGSTDATVDITDPLTLDPNSIVFAYYLQENGTHTGADIWGVTFQPLEHPVSGDDTLGEHDDAIDMFDFLHVTASASLSFSFDTLESGKFLWVAVGDSSNGLLVTGRDLNVVDQGSGSTEGNRVSGGSDPSDAVNTSQGGAGATIGINNQLWVPGNDGVFTFVKGFTALGSGPDATGDNVKQIDYDDVDPYINTVGAGLFISQKQGSPNQKLDMTIGVYEAGGGTTPEEGFGYIGAEGGNNGTSGAFEDDTAIAVETVTVLNASGGTVGTWTVGGNNGATIGGVTINISGNMIDVDDVDALYTIQWTVYDGTTFNRFTLHADDGKFDVGRVDLAQGVLVTENVGADVIIHDDGPTAMITDTGTTVVHDESAGLQDSGIPDLLTGEDNNDDDKALPLPAALAGVLTQGTGVTGWAQSSSAVVDTTGTDFGTDGAATTDSAVWSLDIPAPGTDSGFDDLFGNDILLYEEMVGGQEVIVGRVSGGDNDGKAAIAIIIDQDGLLSVAQYMPIFHNDATDPDDVETMIDSALQAVLTVTDGDGDTHVDTENIGDKVNIEDAGPLGQGLATETLEEDDLDGVGTELSTGNDQDTVDNEGDSSGTRVSVTLDLEDGITSTGVDQPVSYNLDPALTDGVLTGGELPDLFSKGEQLTYVLTHGTLATDPDTIEAFADYAGGTQRLVWTFSVTDFGDGTADATFVLNDQLDHAPYADNLEGVDLFTGDGQPTVDQIDFTDLLVLTDADGDPVDLGNEFVTFEIQDDTPIIAQNLDGTPNPISDGLVDFTTINGANPNDFGGTSASSVTNSLNGKIGTDENDGNNEAADGTKTYTFSSFTTDTSVIAGLQGQLIEDDTRVVYFTDGDSVGNVAGVFDGNDTLFYDIVLNQTDNGGAGSYTFTVYQDPPPALMEFSFEDLPSGQNLHGTIAADKTDPTQGGLLLFPKGAVLDSNGVFVTGGQNASPTTNTSKGGGPVTIGNSNQMFDPTEGHYFISVDNPTAASTAGVGLNQNNADDADTVGFDGTIEVGGAEVEIVQVQGNKLAEIHIEAFDVSFGSAVDSNAEARDLITDPEAMNGTNAAPTSVTPKDIVSVYVLDENGILIEAEAISDGGTPTTDDPDVDIVFNIDGTINVSGIDAGYKIGWETDGLADMWLVEGVSGKYDIGGFNLTQAQPSDDQSFDFTVDITDFDGDYATSNEFSIGIDGTGGFDDDAVTGVVA